MCTLKSPMSQVMSHTSAMAITDQNEGENLLPSEIFVGGGGGYEPPSCPLRSFFIVRSCTKRNFALILDISYLDTRKKLFILCHWKSHTSE